MTRPTVGRFTDLAWSRLPDYMRAADEAHDFAALQLLAAAGDQLTGATRVLDASDAATSPAGVVELGSPTYAPRDWLELLAALTGLSTLGYDKSQIREVVASATNALRRGSVDSMIRSAKLTLTGAKSVVVETRYEGNVWQQRVITFDAETPDPEATEAAVRREKPAGVALTYETLDGLTYTQLLAKYGTYAAMQATGKTYAELAADTTP